MIYQNKVFFLKFKGWMECQGSTTLGERGQVVLPIELRKKLKLEPGDKLIVLGAETHGFQRIILMKSSAVAKMFEHLFRADKFIKQGGLKGIDKIVEKSGVKEAAKDMKKGRKRKIDYDLEV
jgi:AbrB family looped-hinge helix DNA binding protein